MDALKQSCHDGGDKIVTANIEARRDPSSISTTPAGFDFGEFGKSLGVFKDRIGDRIKEMKIGDKIKKMRGPAVEYVTRDELFDVVDGMQKQVAVLKKLITTVSEEQDRRFDNIQSQVNQIKKHMKLKG